MSATVWRIGDTVEPQGDLPPGIREVWSPGHVGTVQAVEPCPPDDYWLTVRALDTTIHVLAHFVRHA